MTTLKTESPRFQEIELKLALLESDTAGLEQRLARMPALARRKAVHLHLHNIYYDTPEQTLRRQRTALRLRRVGSEASPEWLQTLKMGGSSDSALSQRGEWETPVPGAELALSALKATPWSDVDPDGEVFRTLTPSFVTTFERTNWTVRQRDGSVIEVSLDIGQIVADGKSLPLCELELELLAGQPDALFSLARQIARTLAVMPEHRSKAQRGYALADDSLRQPVRAQPPAVSADMPPALAVQRVLSEMFCQFTANLHTLREADDPELVHQARVGWRRFGSACRLFKPLLEAAPAWDALQALRAGIGELRDLDVARTDTLPQFAQAYVAGNARRQKKWQALTETLNQVAHAQRQAVCAALEIPAVGAALLDITQWLQALPRLQPLKTAPGKKKMSFRHWARARIARLHRKLKGAQRAADSLEGQHRVRIFSKRLRYGIEALQPLLNKRRAQRWHQQATELQASIGIARDLAQAHVLLVKLQADAGLAEFLRGVAAGQERRACMRPHF